MYFAIIRLFIIIAYYCFVDILHSISFCVPQKKQFSLYFYSDWQMRTCACKKKKGPSLLFFFEELIWDQVDSNFLGPQERINTTDPGPATTG